MHIEYTTMLINLKKTEEELWEQIGNVRTDIRKAQKNNVEIVTQPTDDERHEAYELYLAMMKKKFLPVEMNYSLAASKDHELIVAKYQGKVVSYIRFQLFSKIDTLGKSKICAFETIASDDSFKHLSVNSLLYWEGIRYMKSLGFEFLNFNGVSYQYGGGDLNSLAFFKRKWNGIEIGCTSKRSLLAYIYWRWFRKYEFVRRVVYHILTTFFQSRFKKY
ncbi:MAG: hypothetical protein HHAS10_02280 [Candidatus Altimarinota bacterium]